jgi:pimeloyl-ACP methyl ester carboxylesterase
MTQKEQLHFVHGNSFPAGSYRQMLSHLEPHYQIQHLEMHGHNPLYPVTDGWEFLVQELIDTLTERYQQPVILLGHSLGGILSLMVAHKRPDLVKYVVMIDAPVVTGWRALLLKHLKGFKFAKRFSPAQFSEFRRNKWTSKEEAFSHFMSKSVFSTWPQEVMQDYIDAGMRPHDEGVTLQFQREIETKIYLTLPHHLGEIAKAKLQVPIAFVGGTESVECRRGGLKSTKKIVKKYFVQTKAGHLMPMEIPEETATLVHDMIVKMQQSNLKNSI